MSQYEPWHLVFLGFPFFGFFLFILHFSSRVRHRLYTESSSSRCTKWRRGRGLALPPPGRWEGSGGPLPKRFLLCVRLSRPCGLDGGEPHEHRTPPSTQVPADRHDPLLTMDNAV
ncbi:unnamed protein product [Arctogadus glacialis]